MKPMDWRIGSKTRKLIRSQGGVQSKLSWMKKFHSFTVEDLTNARKIIYLNDYLADPKNMDKKELCRAFVGINTFETAEYIHKDLKYEDTVGRSGRGWLLSISSTGHQNLKEICVLL